MRSGRVQIPDGDAGDKLSVGRRGIAYLVAWVRTDSFSVVVGTFSFARPENRITIKNSMGETSMQVYFMAKIQGGVLKPSRVT